ncbi:hypothetical protein DFJ74DRAFT_665019 [Hyaloraphidium curvatum]|nr:hypothetical protein DFJ74DRAFT_665019 [Hyaloraphidium curvatum]
MSPLARRALALLALALPQLLFARPADARVPGDHNGKGVLATLRRMPRPDGLEPEDSLHRRQDADGMHWRPDGDRLQRRQSASTCRFSLFTMSVRDFSFTEESAVYEGWLTTVCDGDHSTEDLEVIDVKRNGLEQTGAERRNITDVTGFGANFTFYSTVKPISRYSSWSASPSSRASWKSGL